MGCKLVGTIKGTTIWAGDCIDAAGLRGAAPASEAAAPSLPEQRQARFHPIKNNNSPWMRSWAEGEEMTGKISAEVPNMRQRTVLQYLSLADWKKVDRLPVKAGELTLSRLLQHGWIECRGEKQHTAVRLTPAGLKAMRSPI
jgi:hypothetical protein